MFNLVADIRKYEVREVRSDSEQKFNLPRRPRSWYDI